MKNSTILLAVMLLSVLSGCDNTEKQQKSTGEEVTAPAENRESKESFDVPVFSGSSAPHEFESGVQRIVNEIEKSLSDLNLIEKKLTMTDDSGQITASFKYYFVNGDLWYSDQIFAKYIFDVGSKCYFLYIV